MDSLAKMTNQKIIINKDYKISSDLECRVVEVTDMQPPRDLLKTKLKDMVVQKWCKRWIESESKNQYRQTRIWLPVVNQEFSKTMLTFDRIWLGQMVQFLTGHGWLRRHVVLLGGPGDNLCRLCCEEEETPEHLALECPVTESEVMSSFGNIRETGLITNGNQFQWNPRQLHRFLQTEPMAELLGLQDITINPQVDALFGEGDDEDLMI